MKIRAITLGLPVTDPIPAGMLADGGRFLGQARQALVDAGYEVQTTRLTTPALNGATASPATVAGYAQQLERAAEQAGIDYVALGPVLAADPSAEPAWIDAVADAVLTTERLFGSVQIGLAGRGVNLVAARSCAEAIRYIAEHSDQGFGNLRFAVQANCSPGGPFFPTGYHDGGEPTYAIALEAADLAVDAFVPSSLDTARARLISAIEQEGRRLMANVAGLPGARFAGFDLSLAPFPLPETSIGGALESLGAAPLGAPGTLAVGAFLADTLRRVDLPRCGFSGLMLPVLEDPVLAARWAGGSLTVTSLLLLSAVCGTGLDTVPLPGETTVDQIAGILFDMASLAVVLDKPLTARLLPVPGLAAGEPTRFDFPYFANSSAQALENGGPIGALSADSWLDLAVRRP